LKFANTVSPPPPPPPKFHILEGRQKIFGANAPTSDQVSANALATMTMSVANG